MATVSATASQRAMMIPTPTSTNENQCKTNSSAAAASGLLVWSESLSIGVQELDTDHYRMVEIINKLYEGMVSGQQIEQLSAVLDELIEYTRYHFRHEESYFERAEYPSAAIHHAEHEVLVEQILQVRNGLASRPVDELGAELMNYLQSWHEYRQKTRPVAQRTRHLLVGAALRRVSRPIMDETRIFPQVDG